MRFWDAARGALRLGGKALHSSLRVLGAIFVVAVALGIGLGTYAYRSFSPEDARNLATEQLTSLLHREVTIERLVLAPRGLKILGLRVRRGRAASDGDLLTCGSALVTIKMRPLLDRRLEIDALILQSPQIELTRDEDGNWNLADVFGSSASAGAKPTVLPLALAAAETVVEDGVLRVDDRMRARKFSLRKLALRVHGFGVDHPFPAETSFVMDDSFSGRTLDAEVEASGRVDLAALQWSSATVTADRLRVAIGGVALTGRASATGFPAARIEAAASAPPMGPEQWRRLFGRDVPLSLPAARWTLKGDLPAPGMFDAEKVEVETPAGTASATGLVDFAADVPTLSVELTTRDADLAKAASWVPSLAAHALSGKATLRTAITGWPGRLQAREADLSLRGFGGTWGARRVEGADVDASATDDFTKLKASAAKGKVTAIGNEFDDVAGALTIVNQDLTIERLALRWGGSRVRLRAKVELRREKDQKTKLKEVELSGSADKVDWEAAGRLYNDIRAAISTRPATVEDADDPRPWLRTFKYSIPHGFPDTVGHVRVGELTHANFDCKDVDFLWSLRGVTPALDKISGEARLSFGPGRVADIPAVQDSNKFLRVVFLPFIFMHKMNKLSVFSTATAYPKSLDFAKIDGEYGVSKGVATTRYFHVDSPQLAVYAEGTADLGREQVDMNILTRLADYQGTLPEWWVDEKGRPAIGFRVKGDINKPDLEPRFKKIGADEIEQKVAQARAGAQKRFEALEKLQTF